MVCVRVRMCVCVYDDDDVCDVCVCVCVCVFAVPPLFEGFKSSHSSMVKPDTFYWLVERFDGVQLNCIQSH